MEISCDPNLMRYAFCHVTAAWRSVTHSRYELSSETLHLHVYTLTYVTLHSAQESIQGFYLNIYKHVPATTFQ